MKTLFRIAAFVALGLGALLVLDAARQRPIAADAAPSSAAVFVMDADARADDALKHATVLVMGNAKQRSAAKLDCSCGPDCDCVAGECGSTNCPTRGAAVAAAPKCKCGEGCLCKPGKQSPDCPCGSNCPHALLVDKKAHAPLGCACDCCCCELNLEEGYREAKRRNKPLVIWAGCCCPEREKELSDFVHCYSKGLQGHPVPYVAVMHYIAYGDNYHPEWRGAGFRYIPTAEEIISALSQPMAAKKEEGPACPTCPLPQAQFVPAPMFFPMGGFGGGGCAGGACGR